MDYDIKDLVTLNQIAQTLNQTVDVQSALQAALPRLVELMGLDAGWIFVRDPDDTGSWAGNGYRLAAHYNLPPALALDNPAAWDSGCDCQGLCNKGKLHQAYNAVKCSRLAAVAGDTRGLSVHASAPLRAGDNVLGILNVAAPDWDAFSPRALALLTNVGSQMGAAVERARLYDLLKERRVLEQGALLDLSNQLLGTTSLDDMMVRLVEALRRLLSVDAAALVMPDDDDPQLLEFHAASGWRADPVAAGRRLPADERSGSGWVMMHQQPLIVDDSQQTNLASWNEPWLRHEGFESAAIIPLVAHGHSIGAMVVDMRRPHHFDDSELRFLQLMANQAAIAIEKTRLHEDEIQRQRLEEELKVGQEIQLSFLPEACPVVPGWQFCAIYQAARQVGGDFYDYFELPGDSHRLGLVIADVADKGVPAALFMALGRTLIRSTALSGRSPAAALQRANELILKDTQTDLFLSAFYAILDTHTGRLSYACAGHERPLWWRADRQRFEPLDAAGIVLGVLDAIELEEREIEVQPGDFLVFFTDGVTESLDAGQNEFGPERLKAALSGRADGAAADIHWAVVDAVNAFTAGVPQYDDFTLFVVKRL